MKKFLLIALICLLLLPTLATAGDRLSPVAFPWMTWGEVTADPLNDDEVKLDLYVEQGIRWWKSDDERWSFDTFLAGRGTISSQESNWWDQMVAPHLGFKFNKKISLGANNWGTISVGARLEDNLYWSDRAPYKEDLRGLLFVKWACGGEW